jgi:hypothetical protein
MAERTKAGALEVVLSVRPSSAALMTNDEARSILTDEFLTRLLDLAWKNQFEADRSGPRRDLRRLVSDAIEAQMLGEAER